MSPIDPIETQTTLYIQEGITGVVGGNRVKLRR